MPPDGWGSYAILRLVNVSCAVHLYEDIHPIHHVHARHIHPPVTCIQVNVVYKFGGSSVRDAERMREVADIICSFPQYLPAVVLSAMGKVGSLWEDMFNVMAPHEFILRIILRNIPKHVHQTIGDRSHLWAGST